jgi:regulatory protein
VGSDETDCTDGTVGAWPRRPARKASTGARSDDRPDGRDGDGAREPDADPVEVARLICLRQLETTPRTRSQLASVLARKNVPDEAAQLVLDRFTEVGLIDDGQFARAWVESRQRVRGLSRRALSDELRQRGVPGPQAAQALDELDPALERATARRLVDRKLASTTRLDPATRLRRLGGMLARKGYPAGLAYEVVREALGAEGALDGPEFEA